MIWLLIFCTLPFIAAAQYPLIIDHDGGVDDVIATTLQLVYSPQAIKAITLVSANCYAHPAAWALEQLKAHFLPSQYDDIPIGISTNEGINPFPALWREHAWNIAAIPFWHNKTSLDNFSLKDIPEAKDILAKALQKSSVPVNILITGPCTNIADVLREHPELKEKIDTVFIMGGALFVKGNVEEPGHDGSAEWNIYNNPQAFKEILQSRVHVILISLDATQYTPIRKDFISKIVQQDKKQFRLVGELLETIKTDIESGEYLFWDTLASAAVINPAIIKTEKIAINVVTNGVSMGRIIEDAHGFQIDIALWADQQLFEETVLSVLSHAVIY